ncbi:MAG TPA: hypothetical protein VFG24_05430, partial [Nitrosopumilaceae archaeon]|nr:hypothetical protein [Nitrosopumilaceae archaeon]
QILTAKDIIISDGNNNNHRNNNINNNDNTDTVNTANPFTLEVLRPVTNGVWIKFSIYLSEKYSIDFPTNEIIRNEMDAALLSAVEKQKHAKDKTATAAISLGGKTVKDKRILKKLGHIAAVLSEREWPTQQLDSVVRNALGNVDERTFKNYIECVKLYSTERKNEFGYITHYDTSRFCQLIPDTFKVLES